MRVVCISDTHTYHRSLSLPQGDVLIHAGDATFQGYKHEAVRFEIVEGELEHAELRD